MHRPPRAVIALLVLVAVAVIVWWLWPRGGPRALSGYIEAETLYLSAPVSGAVTAVRVREGDRVPAGAPLFQIDPGTAAAQAAQARAALEAAEAQARDALKGQRPQEQAVVDAQRQAAQARLREAELVFRRVKTLADRGWYSRARLDEARAELDTARAQLRETESRLDVGELGAREDQARAAAARAGQAGAGLDEAAARLRQLNPVAPTAARIEDVFFQRGEWAPANQPVVALLPDDRVKVRFYVPETEVNRYRPGARIHFGCDGCGKGQDATVSWVSPRPEYTPPVIYSRESRDKLVFLVEARPDRPRALTPGLPVDVSPLGEGAGR